MFYIGSLFLSNIAGATSVSCILMKNEECKVSKIINVNSNEPIFYPFSIKRNKCSGSCNNINNPKCKCKCTSDESVGIMINLNVNVKN